MTGISASKSLYGLGNNEDHKYLGYELSIISLQVKDLKIFLYLNSQNIHFNFELYSEIVSSWVLYTHKEKLIQIKILKSFHLTSNSKYMNYLNLNLTSKELELIKN